MSVPARVLVVVAYVALFLVALPLGLWLGGASIDEWLGWPRRPWMGGAVVAGLGLVLVLWGMAVLLLRGGGLPVSALPPPRLTRRGPYRWVRHPIYLGFNVVVLGVGLLVGSRGLAWIVAPAFLPSWVGYALLEERGLVKRFGSEYRRYRRQVGLLPRVGLYRATQFAQLFRVMSVRASGGEHVPRKGPAVLVYNHTSYLDPGYVGVATRRPVHHLTTAEAYRKGALRWVVSHYVNVPVRRYRQDPTACREMLRLLDEGEVVGMAVEGERAVLGRYQGVLPGTARILARLDVPVIPVGISGGYDSGPRWADVVRRKPVRVRVGPPVELACDAAAAIDEAIRGLLDEDPQRLSLAGLPREKLERVLWRCPACGDEHAWQPAALTCGACSERYAPTAGGRLADRSGRERSFAELGESVRSRVDERTLSLLGSVWRERSMLGPIEPLELLGEGLVEIGPTGIRFGSLHVATASIRSASTERADTLQVATRDRMLQVRINRGSAFRLQLALDRWRGAAQPAASGASSPSENHVALGGGRA